jgi:RNA polymerase sigma-70 factor (ECF subfamily)
VDLEALIVTAAGGDPDAANQLLIEYDERVQSIVTKYAGAWLRQQYPVEDMVQEAQVAVFRGLDTYELRDPVVLHFEAWLALLTRRTVAQFVRRAKGSLQRLASDIDDESGRSASSLQRQKERYERLSNAVASLPERDREVVFLHYFRKMTHSEIAEELSLTPEAVNSRLMRARPKLRELLGSTSMNFSTS